MVSFQYSFVLLLSAASVALATVSQVTVQLGFCSNNSTNWDNLINTFPENTTAASFTDVNEILSAAENYSESLFFLAELTAGTGPLSVDVADAILDIAITCLTTLENSLSVLVAKKPSFLNLNSSALPSVIVNELNGLSGGCIAFANSFIGVAPASLSSIDTLLKLDVSNAFATAIAAYS